MEIREHVTLEMTNVLSFRGKMTQQEFAHRAREIDTLIQESGAKKTVPAVTTTYTVEQGPIGAVMDAEILIPLDRTIDLPDGYTWKPRFLLTNAIMIRHVGDPAMLQNTINTLNTYIVSNRLVPITSGYNVTVKEPVSPIEIGSTEIHIYVGISPNVL